MHIHDLLTEAQTGAIRAYHGTRHAFDRFLMKAVGTGEGAQVFGYGLYFAENFEVAKFYADKLGEPVKPEDQHAGVVYEVAINLDPGTLVDWDAALSAQSEFVQKAFGAQLYREEPMINGGRFHDSLPSDVPRIQKIIAMSEYQKANGDLDAFEAGIQARLGPQVTPEAKANFTRIIAHIRQAKMTSGSVMKPGNGGHLMEEFRRLHETPKKATAALRKMGIQGIRYLDEGSRDLVGHATSNFVIFNARYVRIVRKTTVAP